MRSFIRFVENNTRAYLYGCMLIGLAARYAMAHGDMSLWLDPRWPLF